MDTQRSQQQEAHSPIFAGLLRFKEEVAKIKIKPEELVFYMLAFMLAILLLHIFL